jgi:hypothetical protein
MVQKDPLPILCGCKNRDFNAGICVMGTIERFFEKKKNA